MQKKLDEAIKKFKNSQTSLEAYQAISDFVKIIETVPEFIEQAEKEGENIHNAQIELNADKGWTYGLRGRELDDHNKRRDKKGEALFQLNPLFPLVNLNHVRLGIQPENIINNSDWLFHRFTPNEPLPEADRKEYQGFIDKLYKMILPFINEAITSEILETKNEEEMTTEILNTGDIDFSIEKDILYLGKLEIVISSRSEKTKGHYILKHIFEAEEGLDQEYPFSEIAKDEFGDECEKNNSWKKYHHACEYLNDKIRKASKIDDFLTLSTGISGAVRINKKYLK